MACMWWPEGVWAVCEGMRCVWSVCDGVWAECEGVRVCHGVCGVA